MPLKVLLFILADGWDLVIGNPGEDVLLGGVYDSREAVLDIAREAIYTTIITSAPLLLISLIVGLYSQYISDSYVNSADTYICCQK